MQRHFLFIPIHVFNVSSPCELKRMVVKIRVSNIIVHFLFIFVSIWGYLKNIFDENPPKRDFYFPQMPPDGSKNQRTLNGKSPTEFFWIV